MGATEFAFKIRKRYRTNELAVDSTEFGIRGREVQNPLSPTNFFKRLQKFSRVHPGCNGCKSIRQREARTSLLRRQSPKSDISLE